MPGGLSHPLFPPSPRLGLLALALTVVLAVVQLGLLEGDCFEIRVSTELTASFAMNR